MSFIGTQPGYAYSTITKDTFNGDDSTTEFTLSTPATTNGVEVFVENVQQEPTTAYTISGTTLTFTSAPVTGTGNIYVIHRNPTVQTVVPPSGIPLSATTVTATGDISTEGDLKVEVASGGIYTITGTDTATNRTLTLPDEAGTVLTSASTLSSSKLSGALPALDGSALTGVSAGKVLQVVSTLKQNTYSGTADLGSFDDVTGLNATITPSSTSSKILIMVTVFGSPNTSNYTLATRLKRNIGGGASAYPYLGDTRSSSTRASGFGTAGSGDAIFLGFTFLDSPNTTSSTVYTVQAASEAGVNYVIGGSSSSGATYLGSVPSTITLMEIDPS